MNEQHSSGIACRLHDIDPVAYRELARIGSIREIRKNDYGFRAGTNADEIYLLERGCIKIFGTSPEGTEMLLCVSSSGELFGLSEAFRPSAAPRHSYDAVACEDSRLVVIPRAHFRALLSHQPVVAVHIIETLSYRLDESRHKLVNLTSTNMAARVARIVLHMTACYGTHVGNGMELGVPLTQQEVADMVGAARQTVSAILASFKNEGVISITNKRIRIENHARLMKIAGGTTQS